ncbi:MAG: M23 family metallopeptidase [Vicinamibacterales bacterium]
MRFLVRALLLLVALAILAAGVGWFLAGREPGPTIVITSPGDFIGQSATLEMTVATPDGQLTRIDGVLEQNGQPIPVYSHEGPPDAPEGVGAAAPTSLAISQPLGKQAQPALVSGPARLVVTAVRPVLFGLRSASTTVTKDLQVRLEPPRVSVVSLHHFINLGGAEFVVLRATPEDVEAGVRVGDAEYPAYPGSAAGLPDAAARVAFFALRHDQDVNTPIAAYARDRAGNQVTTPIEHRPFPKRFVQSKIPIDQRFLDRVVPAIVSQTPDLKVDTESAEGLLEGFLTINGRLRQQNAETIRAQAAKSAPEMLWREAFAPMGNSQVESRFADQRTYFFEGREIDRQVHLGFDLASVQHAPVRAANAGVVVFADFLGIYGNCVILDHGLGVQSLYAHLSSLGVKAGDRVEKGAELGRTGVTGLAGGDHLHFTMLLQGTAVNPVEWWDPHWMEDRVFRKIREAGGAR